MNDNEERLSKDELRDMIDEVLAKLHEKIETMGGVENLDDAKIKALRASMARDYYGLS